MSDEKPIIFDDDNPEWTEEDFARAMTGDDIPAQIRAAFRNTKPGRPVGSVKANAKKTISLRLDPEVIEGFRSTGPGWQARMNEVLRAALRN